MKKKILILDCFVDEPACLGVPPFLSPYPRYVYGALLAAGALPEIMEYRTIDSVRTSGYLIDEDFNAVFIIGGASVPGKYLGAKIGTVNEIMTIAGKNKSLRFFSGGLVSHMLKENAPENLVPVLYDIEKFAHTYLSGEGRDERRRYDELNRWAIQGATVARQHPDYPHIIAEIETYRGCPRTGNCSFCSEYLFREIEFRRVEDILFEIESLVKEGVTRFRIGRQADIIAYGSRLDDYKNGFPRPEPRAVTVLFNELKKMKNSGKIDFLAVDNANPGTIANFPDESSVIIDSIADAVTPCDTMALGIESFDPAVVKKNNLKVDLEGALRAVRIINGAGRKNGGLPSILPGINLIHGLAGETMETFKINFNSLKKMKEEGLLLKRINIRKVAPFPGTPAEGFSEMNHYAVNRYKYYKKMIRKEIERPMLAAIYPAGTVLRKIRTEVEGDLFSYGRQIASYSIICKAPSQLELKSFNDVIVTGHNERSLSVLKLPIDVNSICSRELEAIPGISKKKAGDIILKRPFKSVSELEGIVPNINKNFLDYFIFSKSDR